MAERRDRNIRSEMIILKVHYLMAKTRGNNLGMITHEALKTKTKNKKQEMLFQVFDLFGTV